MYIGDNENSELHHCLVCQREATNPIESSLALVFLSVCTYHTSGMLVCIKVYRCID